MERCMEIEKTADWCRAHCTKPVIRVFAAIFVCMFFVMCQKTVAFACVDIHYEYEENATGITITGCTDYDPVTVIPEKIDGKKVTEIGEYAFSGKYQLRKVTIPSTVRTIGRGAFFHDENLSAIKIEKPTDGHGIRIESLAMADCPILSSLALPNNITYLADDFVLYSSCTVLGTQSWSEEHLNLYIETEQDASYVLDRMSWICRETGCCVYWQPAVDKLDEPQNVNCYSPLEGKVGVTWNHVAGANAYQVYRSVDGLDGSYQYLATVEDNFFTEDYVQKNKMYIYRIKAVGAVYEAADLTSGTMGWDGIGSVLTDIRNIHALPLRKDAVTLSWNARDDAVDGYYIYQKQGNKWKKIKEVTAEKNFREKKRSVTISGLKCGKNYTFAVQSYKCVGHVYSCSDYRTYTTTVLVRPAATEIKKITKTAAGYNRVQWKRSRDASGYIVYRAVSKNGKYQKIAVIGSGARVYAVDKNAKKGQKYYYKVAAYRNANGEKIRSKVSDAVRK